jgi:hypothetical protein
MTEDLRPFTKERYDTLKARAETAGFTFVTKWRPRLKHICLGDIVLTPEPEDGETDA